MTPAELEAIKARCDAATAGPWEAYSASCCPDMGGVSSSEYVVHAAQLGNVGHPALLTDAEFIAHARQDVPALLAEVARLKAVVDIQLRGRILDVARAEAAYDKGYKDGCD